MNSVEFLINVFGYNWILFWNPNTAAICFAILKQDDLICGGQIVILEGVLFFYHTTLTSFNCIVWNCEGAAVNFYI